MSQGRSERTVSVLAALLWVALATSMWVATAMAPATAAPSEGAGLSRSTAGARVAVAGEIGAADSGAMSSDAPWVTPGETLFVGAAALFALGMGTVRVFGRGREW
jgi:hypothetical protein